MDPAQHRIAFEAFRASVDRAGSQSAFERLTGAKQQNVSNWLRNRKALPAEHVLKAEEQTGVSRHLLRPDIYPVDELSAGGAPVDCDRHPTSQSGDRR